LTSNHIFPNKEALVKIGQNVTFYLQLHLDIFVIISYVSHTCNHTVISLWLLLLSSFHVSNI
jgi:hypothetical protein